MASRRSNNPGHFARAAFAWRAGIFTLAYVRPGEVCTHTKVQVIQPIPPSSVNQCIMESRGRSAYRPINKGREATVNYSMYSADRRTHLKIVAVGLVCAALVAAVGVFAHTSNIDLGTAPLVKAGHSTAVRGHLPAIR